MQYIWKYATPSSMDDMLMCSDGKYLTGLWFIASKDEAKHTREGIYKNLDIFKQTSRWLDIYFLGQTPSFTPPYKIQNLTPFRKEVLAILNTIPFGQTVTYGDIASKIVKKRQVKKMSSQAVGGAVGFNPICIIIPCHRVVGKKGSLIGYGGGIKNKEALLEHERKMLFK